MKVVEAWLWCWMHGEGDCCVVKVVMHDDDGVWKVKVVDAW